ncbi:TPA: response regulator transcription factor [Escherichia coli]|nr:response regulator transcription factor [Escherichia coli]
MNKRIRYIKQYITRHNITVHIWICSLLTETEYEVLELLIKGYTITQISKNRCRSVKTISLQKNRIYKKLNIRHDIIF